ncbi:alkaline phosphatase family protein [Haloarcula onubensis]|uniref:Alkaline phosphatase family protein n=1 Tax=Haloarcula onubensis TaxID=2950539 RepID=A0ABU2FLU3_9EURY|nr:alkaline phosphatase family protein [Halomicroarcula sp. S3CR25-11]MDS0281739.1 alkaline phosphatase family protein [Halomicroarcula sp. S3CR25-11]
MVLVVLGIDALDPELVDDERHPHLTLTRHKRIETIDSHAGEPSTHELWPTIITGLPPSEHGLQLDDGVAWENPLLRYGSRAADYLLSDSLQASIGAWLLTNTGADAFRVPSSYYAENGLTTVFDGTDSTAIGVPNYVVDPDTEDREHSLRRELGDLFERDTEAVGGHTTADLPTFYEQCMEMSIVRTARARNALRSGRYELVFAYTSGLDLVGHVTYDRPDVQSQAYDELDRFVADVHADLGPDDDLLLVSDHGLQDGVHTHEAMVAGTDPETVDSIDSVLDVRDAIEAALAGGAHETAATVEFEHGDGRDDVQERLEDLGYM